MPIAVVIWALIGSGIWYSHESKDASRDAKVQVADKKANPAANKLVDERQPSEKAKTE